MGIQYFTNYNFFLKELDLNLLFFFSLSAMQMEKWRKK